MYKPNDPPRPVSDKHEGDKQGDKQRGRRLTALAGLALVAVIGLLTQLPLGAAAGFAYGNGDRIPSRAASSAAAANQKAPGTYQLRCWQYGRLLFDEGPVTLSPEARQSARLVAIDRHGAALIVTTAGETTCLARPFAAAPNPALPR